MQLTYKYRLKPTKAQLITIATHLELCRRQYNYRLGERFRWWESTRTPINACPLTASIVPVDDIYQNIPLTRTQTRDGRKKDESGNPLTRKGDIFSNIEGGYVQWLNVQLADLKNTKKLFPDYKLLDSQVLQDVVNRVETSFSNFTTPDKSNGERVENPRFLRKSAEKLARLQAKLANKVKAYKSWQIIKSKISRLHQFVARARLDFQFKTAHEL